MLLIAFALLGGRALIALPASFLPPVQEITDFIVTLRAQGWRS